MEETGILENPFRPEQCDLTLNQVNSRPIGQFFFATEVAFLKAIYSVDWVNGGRLRRVHRRAGHFTFPSLRSLRCRDLSMTRNTGGTTAMSPMISATKTKTK